MDIDSLWNTIPRVPWIADSGLKLLGLPVCFPGTSKFAESTFTEVYGIYKKHARCCKTWETRRQNTYCCATTWMRAE